MNLSAKQQLLLEFVKEMHKGQVRKYTNEPYWTHPYAVAEISTKYVENSFEVAICHDLIEYTECTLGMLLSELKSIGYIQEIAMDICKDVQSLTDEFTKEAYPRLIRSYRKEREAHRLSLASHMAQSVKYADLIHNTTSIVDNDSEFAKLYLAEKRHVLDLMRGGDIDLLIECCYSLKKGLIKLSS